MKSDSKIILVLGGGFSQLPFIKTVKQLGFLVACVDINPDCPGSKESDIFKAISLYNYDELELFCNDLSKEFSLAGIIEYSSSTKVLKNYAKLVSKYSLRGFSTESIININDKKKMKSVFMKKGVKSPKYITSNNLNNAKKEISDITFPIIIKPAMGGVGSKAVSIVTSKNEFEPFYQKAEKESINGFVIIEEFCTGREFHVDGFICDGNIFDMFISEKHTSKKIENMFLPLGYDIGNINVNNKLLIKIKDEAEKAIRSLKLNNTCFGVDIILSNEEAFIIEVGILLDALMDKFLYYIGYNPYKALCSIIVGLPINNESIKGINKDIYHIRFLYAKESGIVYFKNDIEDPFLNLKNAEIKWIFNSGDSVFKATSVANLIGYVMFSDTNSNNIPDFNELLNNDLITIQKIKDF